MSVRRGIYVETDLGTETMMRRIRDTLILCGVVFAFMLLSSFTSFKEGEIPLTFILVFVFFIGQQLYEGIVVQNDVSNMAHIVGGVIGGLLGYTLNKKTRFGR